MLRVPELASTALQAANIIDHPTWGEDDTRFGMTERKLQLFLSLLRWLRRHGGDLLQLQCSAAFDTTVGCLLSCSTHTPCKCAPPWSCVPLGLTGLLVRCTHTPDELRNLQGI